jgi:hypothetical protein
MKKPTKKASSSDMVSELVCEPNTGHSIVYDNNSSWSWFCTRCGKSLEEIRAK